MEEEYREKKSNLKFRIKKIRIKEETPGGVSLNLGYILE